MKILEAFQPLSSQVDWCEPNYQVSPYITEFINTVTNIPLILFPFAQYCLYQTYSAYCQPNLRCLLITLQLVGIGSTYFHATLSFAGQLVDECGILWSLSWISAGYWPRHLLPFGIKSRTKFTMTYVFLALCCTILSFFAPVFNQFALIIFGAPYVLTLIADYYLYREPTNIYKSAFRRYIFGFTIAFFIWGLDKSFCPLWRSLYIPYLHGVWHILTAYATAYGVVLCIHEDLAKCGFPLFDMKLTHYPEFLGILGIPCIQIDGMNDVIKVPSSATPSPTPTPSLSPSTTMNEERSGVLNGYATQRQNGRTYQYQDNLQVQYNQYK